MERPGKILLVDDTPANCEVLEAMLTPRGYTVLSAYSGPEALLMVTAEDPDLVLLDVIMPGMDGYAVCRRLRDEPRTRLLPVVMITASVEREKVDAIEAGADDFLRKPINQAELFARVKSLLRVKEYQDTIQRQAQELAEWTHTLEKRVSLQVDELERLGRLRRFLSPQLAEMLVSAEGEALLETHRRQIGVVCCRLAGFGGFAETTAPEEVMAVLREYHAALGSLVARLEGTVGALAAERLTVFFNDPLPSEDPAGQAVRLALAARDEVRDLARMWLRRGWELNLACGVDLGYATLGTIDFGGRIEYGAVGSVVHLASALCDRAQAGQILMSHRAQIAVDDQVEATLDGDIPLDGFVRPVPAYGVATLRAVSTPPPPSGPTQEREPPGRGPGPLTEREGEVARLIAEGLTNREIAETLIIAEGTAVRHVANILNKLGLRSRAQVAVWATEHASATARAK